MNGPRIDEAVSVSQRPQWNGQRCTPGPFFERMREYHEACAMLRGTSGRIGLRAATGSATSGLIGRSVQASML
jgi:hypothetical protein